jgi:3-oxoacyl-[acyl-carrier protein] reductase
LELEGQVAIVTGGGRGIGRAIALALASQGARVAVNYNRSAEAAGAVAAEIRANGGDAFCVQADVADGGQVAALVAATTDRYGCIDILVNNAGITRDRLIVRMKDEDWDAVLDTNLKGAFLCARAVAPIMMKQKSGVIVNVGSVIGKAGGAGQANYSAAKAGLVGLTKSLARELGSRGVRVNAVAPGFICTEMTDVLKEEQRQEVLRRVPVGRLGTPEDVATVVGFLCAPGSGYITGEVIAIDGGLFM